MYYCQFTAEGECTEEKQSGCKECEGLRIDCDVYEADETSLDPVEKVEELDSE